MQREARWQDPGANPGRNSMASLKGALAFDNRELNQTAYRDLASQNCMLSETNSIMDYGCLSTEGGIRFRQIGP